MSGFFAVDRHSLPESDSWRPIGYKIGLELIVRGELAVREVPIAFSDRQKGSSRFNWHERLKFLRHLLRLCRFRYPLPTQHACFGTVGTGGFAVDVACWLVLQRIGFDHRWSRFVSFWPVVIRNWNRRAITFGDRPPAPLARQWLQFIATSPVVLQTNVGTYLLLTARIASFDDNRLQAMVVEVLVGMMVNFAVADRLAFRQEATE